MLIITGKSYSPRPYVQINRPLILTDCETPIYVTRNSEQIRHIQPQRDVRCVSGFAGPLCRELPGFEGRLSTTTLRDHTHCGYTRRSQETSFRE